MCFPEVRKKSEKNIKKVKKTSEHGISPLCRNGPARPIFTIFGLLGHTADVITPVKFQVDRSKGFGARGTQNRVFPIDFDRRPYNSVTHYRAAVLYCGKPQEPCCRRETARSRVNVDI